LPRWLSLIFRYYFRQFYIIIAAISHYCQSAVSPASRRRLFSASLRLRRRRCEISRLSPIFHFHIFLFIIFFD
jgi:hypothetical protein